VQDEKGKLRGANLDIADSERLEVGVYGILYLRGNRKEYVSCREYASPLLIYGAWCRWAEGFLKLSFSCHLTVYCKSMTTLVACVCSSSSVGYLQLYLEQIGIDYGISMR
jgi:hypothetical protein